MSTLAFVAVLFAGAVAAVAGLLWLALWVYTRRSVRRRYFESVRESVHQVRLRQYERAERDGSDPPTEYLRAPYWDLWR